MIRSARTPPRQNRVWGGVAGHPCCRCCSPVGARWRCGTTATGQSAWCRARWATLLSPMPIKPPGRRAPTTRRAAAADRSASTLRAVPPTVVRRSTSGFSRAAVSMALSRIIPARWSWSRVTSPGRTWWSTGSWPDRRQVQTTSSSASPCGCLAEGEPHGWRVHVVRAYAKQYSPVACLQGVPVPAHDDDRSGGSGGHDEGHGSEYEANESATTARTDGDGLCRASFSEQGPGRVLGSDVRRDAQAGSTAPGTFCGDGHDVLGEDLPGRTVEAPGRYGSFVPLPRRGVHEAQGETESFRLVRGPVRRGETGIGTVDSYGKGACIVPTAFGMHAHCHVRTGPDGRGRAAVPGLGHRGHLAGSGSRLMPITDSPATPDGRCPSRRGLQRGRHHPGSLTVGPMASWPPVSVCAAARPSR